MSYNSGSGKHDYRGRGKKAAGSYRGKHYRPSEADSKLVPIGDTAVEARVGRHEKAAQPEPERDPFAPSDDYVPAPSEPVVDGAAPQVEPAAGHDAAEGCPAEGVASESPQEGKHGTGTAPLPVSEPGSADAEKTAGEEGAEDGTPSATPVASVATLAPKSEEAAKYDRGDERYTKHKPGFSRGQKIAIAIVAVVAAIVFAVAGVALAFYQDTQSNIELSDQTIKDELQPAASNEAPYWALIMGSDSRTTDTSGTRSDVIMLARIDEPNKQITLVSIPRDTYVPINGTYDKINAAYSYGGAKQMIRTVQDFAGIKISHYAEIYFKGFSKLVDDIGGVDVVVPETGSYHGVTIQKGKQHLNGKEALTFARIRKSYASGDFRRTECQRILVQALAKKILSQDVTEIPATITSASECFSTDMSLTDIVTIATYMKGMDTDDMYSAMAPSTTGMIGGVSYTFTYNNQWILMMQKANNGQNPKLTKKEQEICGTGNTQYTALDMQAGLPATTQEQLQDYWNKQNAKKAKKQSGEQSGASASSADATSSDGGTKAASAAGSGN